MSSQSLGTEVVCVGAVLLVAVLCCGTGLVVGHETGDFSVDVVVFLKDLVLVIKQKAAASLLCSLPPCWFNLK